MRQTLVTPAALSLLLASCTLGPDYVRPPIETPAGWRDGPAADHTIANLPWWEVFEDPTLQELIRSALDGNQDLKIAVERIEEARALYGFERANRYPRVDVTGDAGRLRASGRGPTAPPAREDLETDFYRLSADLSWEIDFFGRLRRATEAQYALLLATEEARRAVVIILVSDVAMTYFELRDADARLEIARRTLTSRGESMDLARVRFEGGVTSEVDYRQALAEYDRVEVTVFDLERLASEKENELSVLLGRNPATVPRGQTIDVQGVPVEVPAGLPAELLERRPDLREAEQLLVADNARIGEAKALLYPRIALTGSFGYESTEIDQWLTAPARSWSLVGSLLQPIFNAGQNRRRVEVSESRMRQSLFSYERAIQGALLEAEDALVAYRTTGRQRASQSTRVAAEREVLRLAELRYRGGVTGYLEVLDAQRSLFTAELEEVQTIRENLVALVRLYKALGGGWTGPSAATI